MIHCIHPYRIDKNLGKAYNDAFKNCPEEDWLCLMDWDVMFLLHDAIAVMEEYVTKYPGTGIFTCYTNRIHTGAKDQLWGGVVNTDADIKQHIGIAAHAAIFGVLDESAEIKHHISGMLMLISKKTWNEIKFSEDGKCLGVDNDFSDRVLAAGKKILRMNRIYVWHTYRLMQGMRDKSHLL